MLQEPKSQVFAAHVIDRVTIHCRRVDREDMNRGIPANDLRTCDEIRVYKEGHLVLDLVGCSPDKLDIPSNYTTGR